MSVATEPGWSFVELDFDRIEPVCLAVVANIAAWKEVFRRRLDIYRVVANAVDHMGVDLTLSDDKVREQLAQRIAKPRRNIYKTQVLAIMYERGPSSFASTVGISVDEAKIYFSKFDKAYPEIEVWKNKIKSAVRLGDPIYSLFGRRRTLTYVEGARDAERVFRQGINHPIQALASDITLWQLHYVYEYLDRTGLIQFIRPCNFVHDSIWLLGRDDYLSQVIPIVEIMEDRGQLPFEFDVPLGITGKVGKSLGQMSESAFTELRERFIREN